MLVIETWFLMYFSFPSKRQFTSICCGNQDVRFTILETDRQLWDIRKINEIASEEYCLILKYTQSTGISLSLWDKVKWRALIRLLSYQAHTGYVSL